MHVISGTRLLFLYLTSQDDVIKNHVRLCIGGPHGKLVTFTTFWYWRYGVFSLSHNAASPRNLKIMRLNRKGPLKESHHFANFGGYEQSGSGDKIT